MRLLELRAVLTEASLTAAEITKYPWRQDLFLGKIRSGQEFELNDGTTVVIKKSEALRLKKMMDAGAFFGPVMITSADGEVFPLGKLKKSAEFVKQGATAATVADDTSISNRGDVAEGILSAALFAKLKARTAGRIQTIGNDDVWAVVDSLKRTGADSYTVTVKDAGKKVVNDTIAFTLVLPRPAYLDFVNPNKRAALQQETASAVAFANSEDNTKFSEYFYLNGKPDIIEIICDGGNPEKQKVSKVDIEVVVTDKLTGKKSRKRLDISLKANAKQFGQVGAGSEKKQDYFEKQQQLWDKFGLDINPVRAKFDETLSSQGLEQAIGEVYRFAASTMAELLSGDNDEEEYLYLNDLDRAINYFATLNNPNIILVSFERGSYEVLGFNQIADRLKSVNLTAKYNEKAAHPQVDIFDSNTGKILLQIRLKFTGTEKRNYVEKGPLMSSLLSIKKKS